MLDDMMSVPLAMYKRLELYTPKLGDLIVYHGWFSHYYGIINSINDSGKSVQVIKAGMPLLLFTMDQEDMDKNTITLKTRTIKSSRGGKFSILQDRIWYL